MSLVKNDTLDGDNSSKSAIDNMLELIDLMTYEDSDLKNMYITDVIEDGKEVLYLDVTIDNKKKLSNR